MMDRKHKEYTAIHRPKFAPRHSLALMFCVLLSAAAAAQEAKTSRYDWLTAGEVSGAHVLQVRPDGTRVADFEFNDRGRGPKIHQDISVADDGTPEQQAVLARALKEQFGDD